MYGGHGLPVCMPDCFKLDGKGEYIRNNTEDSEPRRGVPTSKNIMSKEGKVSRSESEADIVQNHSMSKKKNRLSPGNQEGNGQLSRSISNDGIIIIQSRAALTGNPSYSNGVNEQHEAVLRSEGGNGRSNMLQGEINAFVPYTSFFFFFLGHSWP